ncbi:hypothetical protein V2J09_018135 [Rumex salicifolius]
MVPSSHVLPLRLRPEPPSKIHRASVHKREVRIPEIAADVEASVVGHKNRRRLGGITGQTLVALHPLMEDNLQRELVSPVPTSPGKNLFPARFGIGEIHHGRSKAGIDYKPAHMDPFVERAAIAKQIGVEPPRNSLNVDVAAETGVGIEGGTLELRSGNLAWAIVVVVVDEVEINGRENRATVVEEKEKPYEGGAEEDEPGGVRDSPNRRAGSIVLWSSEGERDRGGTKEGKSYGLIDDR